MAKKPVANTPVTPDITSLSTTVESALSELNAYNTGIVIFSNDEFDRAALMYEELKKRKAALEETTQPVVDSVKALKSSVDKMIKRFSSRYDAIEESLKESFRSYLENQTSDDEKPQFGRLQGGQWVVNIKDEEALKAHILSKPELHYLLEVSASKLKALASAQTTAFKMPGAEAKQGMSLFISTKGMEA